MIWVCLLCTSVSLRLAIISLVQDVSPGSLFCFLCLECMLRASESGLHQLIPAQLSPASASSLSLASPLHCVGFLKTFVSFTSNLKCSIYRDTYIACCVSSSTRRQASTQQKLNFPYSFSQPYSAKPSMNTLAKNKKKWLNSLRLAMGHKEQKK